MKPTKDLMVDAILTWMVRAVAAANLVALAFLANMVINHLL